MKFAASSQYFGVVADRSKRDVNACLKLSFQAFGSHFLLIRGLSRKYCGCRKDSFRKWLGSSAALVHVTATAF